MRNLIVLATVLSVLSATAAWSFADEETEGLTGTLTLIPKNKENAATVDKVKVKIDDEVEITWTYPIVPGSIPKKVAASSSNDAMHLDDIVRVVRPGFVGAGSVGAFFTAKKEGTATLKFEINNGEANVTLQCEVEVVK
jgi:hypothetical protein